MELFNKVIEVMREVVERDLELDMNDFYANESTDFADFNPNMEVHTCGTAACILGYAALEFRGTLRYPPHLWNAIHEEIPLDTFLTSCLSNACFGVVARRWNLKALAKKQPQFKPLLDMPHVNKEPTAQEALDFLVAVKEILEQENE